MIARVYDDVSRNLTNQHAALRDDIDRVHEWSKGRADIFGGLWFDNDAAEAGTGPVIIGLATTADPHEITQEIARLVRSPERVRVIRCAWSYRELSELLDQIFRDFGGPRPNGSSISICGVDEVRNVVYVGIATDDEAFAQEILDRYGQDRVRVELGMEIRPA